MFECTFFPARLSSAQNTAPGPLYNKIKEINNSIGRKAAPVGIYSLVVASKYCQQNLQSYK